MTNKATDFEGSIVDVLIPRCVNYNEQHEYVCTCTIYEICMYLLYGPSFMHLRNKTMSSVLEHSLLCLESQLVESRPVPTATSRGGAALRSTECLRVLYN